MKKIVIELKMFMTLKKYLPAEPSEDRAMVALDEGSTFEDLLNILGIPIDQPKLVIINGISQGVTTEVNNRLLQEGDIVCIFPPAGGG